MRLKRTAVLLLTVLMIIGLYSSCGEKRPSLGNINKVIVVADSTLWLKVQDEVRDVLARKIFTPQPEAVFSFLQRNPDQLGRLSRVPNILLLGTLDAEGEVKEYVDNLLSESSREQVIQNNAFLFNKRDAWSTNQMLVVAVSNNVEDLQQDLQANSDQLFDIFNDFVNERVKTNLFRHMEKKELSERFMKEHGWSLRVQPDFFIVVDSLKERLTLLERLDPQRWISVYYEPSEDPYELSKSWMLQRRADISDPYYDGDYVTDKIDLTVREVDFCGFPAIQLTGVWQNDKKTRPAGGPFKSYGFYDPDAQRLYLVDMAVFAPGDKKLPYLRQLDVMARTFKTQTK